MAEVVPPLAAFKEATQTLCNGNCVPNKTSETATVQYIYNLPVLLGHLRLGYCPRFIVHMNHIKKQDHLSNIETLGGCYVSTLASWPLTLPGWPFVLKDMIKVDLVGKIDPRYCHISRYDRASNDGYVFNTTRLNTNELLHVPKMAKFSG